MINERREALKNKDMERWREIYQEMAALDEECLQDVLELWGWKVLQDIPDVLP